ncbi:MAG: hypothetical protein ACUVQZ_04105 [Candidatus Caldatribacteriaceae bacterium]
MIPQKTSESAIYGKMVIELFALHREKKDTSLFELLMTFIKEKPRDILLLLSLSPEKPPTIEDIIQKIAPLYTKLCNSLESLGYHYLIPEELIFCEKVGLIGRLDFLGEKDEEKSITEVKIGKTPNSKSAWPSHKMQVTGYLHPALNLGLPVKKSAYLFI